MERPCLGWRRGAVPFGPRGGPPGCGSESLYGSAVGRAVGTGSPEAVGYVGSGEGRRRWAKVIRARR